MYTIAVVTTEQFSIKHRPRSFEEIVGQDAVRSELLKRAKTNNWPRAMLLKGPYGTGKTTAAHLIAAAIQSKGYPINSDSASVRAITTEAFDRDTLVLDGSQLGGKDSVVEFTSTINVTPMYDAARIYIIEEADQLSKAAANALLKVLEQPRANVHFILLSMEANGVPRALQSRCQTYVFKPASISATMSLLKGILEAEGLWAGDAIPAEFKLEGLASLASAAKGSLREATQLLERCLIGEYFTLAQIRDEMGVVDENTAYRILQNLSNGVTDGPTLSPLYTADPAELYNYFSLVLSGAILYKNTGFIHDERFKQSTQQLAASPHAEQLFEILNRSDMAAKPYIRRADIISAIAAFASRIETTEDGTILAVRKVRKV